MGRKKKSLAARAAERQAGDEAASTSQQIPAQSGSQTQPKKATQGAPVQAETTQSKPKAQAPKSQKSGVAQHASQPTASAPSAQSAAGPSQTQQTHYQTVSPPTVMVRPPDARQPQPGQYQPKQTTFQHATSEPRGQGLPSPMQAAAPGQYMTPQQQIRFPGASPVPTGWGPPGFSPDQQQPAQHGPRAWSSGRGQRQPTPAQPAAPGPSYPVQYQPAQHGPRAWSSGRGQRQPTPAQPAAPGPSYPVQYQPGQQGPRAWSSGPGQRQPTPAQPAAPGPSYPVQYQPGQQGPRAWSSSPGQRQPTPVQPAAPGAIDPSTVTQFRSPSPGSSASGLPGSGKPHQHEPSPGPSGIVSQIQYQEPQASTSGSGTLQPTSGGSEHVISSRKKGVEVCRYAIPNKIPGRTVRCTPVTLECNYLQMALAPTKLIRYDIAFKPDKPKKLVQKAYAEMKKRFFPQAVMAFDDSKLCFVREPLPGVGERLVKNVEIVDDNKRQLSFEITIVHTGVLSFETLIQYMKKPTTSLSPPTEVIQALDIILRQGILQKDYIKAGRQFFKQPSKPLNLTLGLEMWTGLFQSGIITNKMFLNVDVAHKGFPKNENLVDLLYNDFGMDPNYKVGGQRSEKDFLDFLKGLRVSAKIFPSKSSSGGKQEREFIVNALAEPPITNKFEFTDEKGVKKMMTVKDYFEREKGYKIKYPKLDCVWVGPREKRIMYPMELLTVVYGQVRNKQLHEKQLSNMVRAAAVPPDERIAKIWEIIDDMKYSENFSYQHFGIKINDNRFHSLPGKVLAPPKIDCGEVSPMPRDGQWRLERLFKKVPFPKWFCFSLDNRSRLSPTEVVTEITKHGRSLGMEIPSGESISSVVSREKVSACLQTYFERGFKLAFVIISPQKDIYHHVKTQAECNVGILTQCIKSGTLQKFTQATVNNILLKVNAKLMGINHKIHASSLPMSLSEREHVMVVGADVTHPSPDQKNVPSIAAVIASINNSYTIYNMEISIQAAKVEIISQFEDMMQDHFKLYRERNHSLPTKIYVYRDGVSEGQFSQVLNEELTALNRAYQKVGGTKKPQVLFLLVQKRHHTRLFNPAKLKDRWNKNVTPGTLADVDIVHPTELDFYLVSHQAIKGTARPTRYHQVCNDMKMPDDEVQQLTHYLCHLFARCPRSVSYPAPTYYAHLACLRARSLTY